jgi:DNA-binding HxlR family transcriptional regulator
MKVKNVHCEVENLLLLLGGRWKVLIIRRLAEGACRHGQLLRSLDGITQKILTQRLRELETAGILHRSALLEGRVKVVEYSLTGWGVEVMTLVKHLHEWAVGHKAQIARHAASGSRVKSA